MTKFCELDLKHIPWQVENKNFIQPSSKSLLQFIGLVMPYLPILTELLTLGSTHARK